MKKHRTSCIAVLTRFTVALALTTIANVLFARTLYVEKWGDDTSINCSRKAPCLTLQRAIGLASNNDKVTVGPGEYLTPSLQIAARGMKLYSTAGRHATILRTNAPSTLNITTTHVRVGKKGKGFTFLSDSSGGLAGVVVETSIHNAHIKIEGNSFGLPRNSSNTPLDDFSNHYGLLVNSGGGKITVRNNIFQNSESSGFYCQDCVGALIRDNRFESNGGTGVQFSTEPDSLLVLNRKNNLFIRNLVSSNLGAGIEIFSVGGGLPGATQAYLIRENISEMNDLNGVYARFNIEGSIEKNIINQNGSGFSAFATNGPLNVSNNYLGSNSRYGLTASQATDMEIKANIANASAHSGFRLENSNVRSFNGNSSIQSTICGVIVDNLHLLNVRYFFRHNLSEDVCLSNGGTYSEELGLDAPGALGMGQAPFVIGG